MQSTKVDFHLHKSFTTQLSENELTETINGFCFFYAYKIIVSIICISCLLFYGSNNFNVLTNLYYLVSLINILIYNMFRNLKEHPDLQKLNKNILISFLFLVFYWFYGWVIYTNQLHNLQKKAFALFIILIVHQWFVILYYSVCIIFIVCGYLYVCITKCYHCCCKCKPTKTIFCIYSLYMYFIYEYKYELRENLDDSNV